MICEMLSPTIKDRQKCENIIKKMLVSPEEIDFLSARMRVESQGEIPITMGKCIKYHVWVNDSGHFDVFLTSGKVVMFP